MDGQEDALRARVALAARSPSKFNASLQPRPPVNTGPPVDMAAQKKQWKSSLAKFTRLLWSMDWETSLKELAKDSNATQTFARWMQTEAVGDASSVEALAAISSVKGKPNAAGEAMQLCARYLGSSPGNGQAALRCSMDMCRSSSRVCRRRPSPSLSSRPCAPASRGAHRR